MTKRIVGHTPGPWTLIDCKIVGQNGCTVVSLWGAMNGEDTDADCRLIAAAPDLLEALRDTLHRTLSNGQMCICDDCERIRAALAKAHK